jgi:serine protease Do
VTINQDPSARPARGSGFIIDPAGIIVTNNHVAAAGNALSVTLDDGTELAATVVGADPRTDLAVLKVQADRPLPFLQLGDSDKIRPGEWVVAVGNPFGLGGTVTAGIVSALGRDLGAGPYDQFLQTDAAINQGNSGGPLFSRDGKVVGVNTVILSPTGGSVGIGFAIPSNLVKDVAAQLRATGHVARGFLGIQLQPVTPAIATGLGLEGNVRGALVADVAADSPAASAGVNPGDLIQSINSAAIANPHEFARRLAGLKPGDTAQIALLRDGHLKVVDVTLCALPEQAASVRRDDVARREPDLGVVLAPLSPELRDRLKLPSDAKGAFVALVQPDSPAGRAGLQQGDVLASVGAKPVADPADAVSRIRAAMRDGKAVALRVLRDGQSSFVAIPGAPRS